MSFLHATTDKSHLRALIYCRISSLAQAKKGDGLQSQETANREYCKRKGYRVEKVFYDRAISGKLIDRPGIKELLHFLKRAKNAKEYVVVFDDVSRFARDMRTHLDLRDAIIGSGAQIDCPTVEFREDSQGRYFEEIQALNAQHYGRFNAEQTKKRMRSRMLAGFWTFAAPLGYRFQKTETRGNVLVRDEPLASVIQEALEGFASGRFDTQAEVKRFLETREDFTAWKKENRVSYEDVYRLLTRHVYSGYIEYADWGISLREGKHEGLVDLATYERIQDRIKEGARVPARPDINAAFPLRGFVTCGDCDKPLTACWSKSNTGKKHPYYLCFNKDCESYRKSIRRDVLEGEFETILKGMQPTGTLFNYVSVIFKGEWDKRLAQMQEIKKALRREILKLDNQIETLMDRIVDAQSDTTITAYERRIARLEKDKLLKAEKLAKPTASHRGFDEMFERALTFVASPWKLWESERLEDKRTVLKLAFEGRLAYCRKEGFRAPQASEPFRFLGLCDHNQGMADRQGFEPWKGYKPLPVFKTGAFNHSAICPFSRFSRSENRQL